MHHAVKAWCIVSTSGRLAIKTPGIHYEYRDFSDFLTLFEMAQLAVLGHLGQKSVFLGHTVRVSGGIFMPFFGAAHRRYTRKPWLCSPQ